MKKVFYLVVVCISFFSFAQKQDKVDFMNADIKIYPSRINKQIKGSVTYNFMVLAKVDSIFLDAKNMNFSVVLLNNRKVKHKVTGEKLILFKKFKKGKSYQLSVQYSATPKQAVYFIDNTAIDFQIWTQGQGKYTSHWLPSFDDMNEKVAFNLEITFDKKYTVIANGKLVKTKEEANLKTWSYSMDKPMSSYLLAFAIGDYDKKIATSTSEIPLEMYYTKKDSLLVEPTYRYTESIFNFLEKEIGIPYPWQNYKQIPVKDFLYGGMENTGTTIFSDNYVVDSIAFIDKNYVNVNAHELAHQWFGNLVTEVDGNHHWLHEGFATYYALLAEKEIFGADYYYWKLYNTAKQLNKLSKDGKGEALTNPKASSLTFYEKGAWALVMLREQLGIKAFREGIQNYLVKHQFKNVTITDFIFELEKTADIDLSNYKTVWLQETKFPYKQSLELLKKASKNIADFLVLKKTLTTSMLPNETIIKKYWSTSTSSNLKQEIIATYYSSLSEDFVKTIFKTKDVKIRQTLAYKMDQIPIGLKSEFESLLIDKSYYTIENALYKLWVYFPLDRIKYLEKTKDIYGMPSKNVRLLWLTLASVTKNYKEEKQADFIEELRGYTSNNYSYEVRQRAFEYLNEIGALSTTNLKDLLIASDHHSWQFKKYVRNLITVLLEKNVYKKRLIKIAKEFKEKTPYIKTKLQIQ